MHFKLWTLLWGPFFMPLQSGMAFLMILFELYMAMNYFPAYEKEMGSTLFLFWAFLVNTLNSLVFLAFTACTMVYYHLNQSPKEFMVRGSSVKGLWPLVMVCITLTSLSNPDGRTNFWGMVQIPNKWYPLALTGFFILINGGRVLWNLLAALAVGYAYSKFRLERLLPSKPRLDRLEQRCCRGGRCSLLGSSWIPASSTSSYDVDVQVDRRYRNFADFGQSERTTQSAPAQGGQFVLLLVSSNAVKCLTGEISSSWPSAARGTAWETRRPPPRSWARHGGSQRHQAAFDSISPRKSPHFVRKESTDWLVCGRDSSAVVSGTYLVLPMVVVRLTGDVIDWV
ncbi:unnamed protein product [Effrenium voratum]|nr:unnamed protein product [Effrenium voratum]